METMIEYVHNHINKNDIGIDFTMGNGHDTLYLSEHCNYVYSFDIQQVALDNTKLLIKDKENVSLILDNHLNFDKYVKNFDVGIFNLGYLPNGDHTVTTDSQTTIDTIDKALTYLNKKGQLFIVVYIGHEEGKQESKVINEYVSNLNHKLFNVALFRMLNKNQAPYVIHIEKNQ